MRPLIPKESGKWEHTISAIGSTTIRWVPIVLGFSLIRCFVTTLRFSPVRREVGALCPLVASILLLILSPMGNTPVVGGFACEDLHSSCWIGLFLLCLWLLWDLGIQILRYLHHHYFHPFHSSPHHIYILLDIWQPFSLFFYLIDCGVSPIVGLFVGCSRCSKYLLMYSCHFLRKYGCEPLIIVLIAWK